MVLERWVTCIIFILAILAICSWIIVPSINTEPVPVPNQTQTNQELKDFEKICEPLKLSQSQLFRLPGNNNLTTAPLSANSWESTLYGVQLKGTAGNSMAVIANLDGSNERIAHVDDRVGDAEITRIDRNRIELTGPAGPETLELPGLSTRKQPMSSDGSVDEAGNLRVINRSTLRSMVEQVDNLSQEITLQPVRHADGTPAGFRVTALKPMGLLAKMGIRRKDILTSVNGSRIISLEDVYRVLESAVNRESLTLELQRNNQKMELTYVLQ